MGMLLQGKARPGLRAAYLEVEENQSRDGQQDVEQRHSRCGIYYSFYFYFSLATQKNVSTNSRKES
jgi:hypothetical protein